MSTPLILTRDQLAAAAGIPKSRATSWLPPITAACRRFEIDTPARLAAFLAQVSHESGGFRYVRELWGPTDTQRRYEGRRDLGNTQRGDGFRFRGRGLIQITGRTNYRRVAEALNVPCEVTPALLEQPDNAALSAAWFWRHGAALDLNPLADQGDFRRITRLINGGYNGWDERHKLYLAARQSLGALA